MCTFGAIHWKEIPMDFHRKMNEGNEPEIPSGAYTASSSGHCIPACPNRAAINFQWIL